MGVTAAHFWRLSLGVLYGLVKAMFACDRSKDLGSEAQGEGRERVILNELPLNHLLSPEGWWDICLLGRVRICIRCVFNILFVAVVVLGIVVDPLLSLQLVFLSCC